MHSKYSKPPNFQVRDGPFITPSGQIWIQQEATNIQLRLLVISRTLVSVHRGQSVTIAALTNRFSYCKPKTDAKLFVGICICWLSTTGRENVPPTPGLAMFRTKHNDLLKFDNCDLGKSTTGDRYILMIREDHSGYSFLYTTPSTDVQEVAYSIIVWCDAFGPRTTFMSDSPTHFRNEFMRLLARGLKCKHHFTQA